MPKPYDDNIKRAIYHLKKAQDEIIHAQELDESDFADPDFGFLEGDISRCKEYARQIT